mgnify:FL=1
MKFKFDNAKYDIEITSKFKSDYKKIRKQNKDINKLIEVLEVLANGEELPEKYKNHKLINDKFFKECWECHIQPDWLLVYKIQDNELVLLLFATGSHSDLFGK